MELVLLQNGIRSVCRKLFRRKICEKSQNGGTPQRAAKLRLHILDHFNNHI